MTQNPLRLLDLFRYYKELPHQMAAIKELEETILKKSPGVLNRDQGWFKTWSQAGKQDEPRTPKSLFTPDKPWDFKITPHISYGELSFCEEERRFVKQQQCDTALRLCQYLEQVRMHFGNKPIVITSGYRPPAVNRRIGGSTQSEHLYNMDGIGAIDFYIAGVDIYKVQEYVDKTWDYSLGYGAPKGFVHVGMRLGKPRIRWNY
jgi:hypothetical protein